VSASEKGHQWELALSILAEAASRDLQAGRISYSAALSAGGENGAGWQWAASLLEEMQLDGVVFSKSLVHAVLTACAATCDSELASELVARSELPRGDRDLCAALIKVYAACEEWDMACCIYEEVMLPASLKLDPALIEVLLKAATNFNNKVHDDFIQHVCPIEDWPNPISLPDVSILQGLVPTLEMIEKLLNDIKFEFESWIRCFHTLSHSTRILLAICARRVKHALSNCVRG